MSEKDIILEFAKYKLDNKHIHIKERMMIKYSDKFILDILDDITGETEYYDFYYDDLINYEKTILRNKKIKRIKNFIN